MYNIASIIVTYNGYKWIERCLNSLVSSGLKTDIYVIDNNSKDNTLDIVKGYSEIHLLENNQNSGFGSANTILLHQLYFDEKKYDYFFLINQDAWIETTTILQLVEFMNANRDYGIVSPVHYNKDFSQVDFNFNEYLNQGEKVKEKVVDTHFVNAAVWMMSRTCLEKVGIFNPYFKHYGEDKNYCNRVEYKGLKIGVLLEAKANHDRERVMDFIKISKLAKIKLDCIILNPNDNLINAYLKALKNTIGVPKYYSKILPKTEVIELFFNLTKHYLNLVYSLEIRKNREAQKKDLFLIKQ